MSSCDEDEAAAAAVADVTADDYIDQFYKS
jgi:hypothetical protein